MVKITYNDQLKIKILNQYKKENNPEYTASYLAKLLKSKFSTIKKAMKFLYKIGLFKKDVKNHGENYYVYYSLTKIGNDVIKNLKQ